MASPSMDSKEEIINKKIEMMRRKNEMLIRRHQEIEADKRDAELLSKGIGSQEHQIAGDKKGLSPTGLANTGRGKKLQEFASHKLKAEELEKILDPNRRQAMNITQPGSPPRDPCFNFLSDPYRENGNVQATDRHEGSRRHFRNWGGTNFENVKSGLKEWKEREKQGYGQNKGKIDMTLSMTGRQRREYEEWRTEREKIDVERISRHKNATGGWKREWDADKLAQGDSKSPSVSFSSNRHQRGSRIGSGRFPAHDDSKNPPRKISECWDDSTNSQKSDNRDKLDSPHQPEFKDNPRKNEYIRANRPDCKENYHRSGKPWEQRKKEQSRGNYKWNEQSWDNQRKNESLQNNSNQSESPWIRSRYNNLKEYSNPIRSDNFRRSDSHEKSGNFFRRNTRENVRRSDSWEKSDFTHRSDRGDPNFRGGRGGKFNRRLNSGNFFTTNKEPQNFENVFQDGEEEELNKEIENAPISSERKVLQKQDLLIISITNDFAAGGENQLRKEKLNNKNKDNQKIFSVDKKESNINNFGKLGPSKIFNNEKQPNKQDNYKASPVPDKPISDSPKTIHSPNDPAPSINPILNEVIVSDLTSETKVEEDWDIGGDESWEDCTSGSLELSGQSLSQHSEDASVTTKVKESVSFDSTIQQVTPTSPDCLKILCQKKILDWGLVVDHADSLFSFHNFDGDSEKVMPCLESRDVSDHLSINLSASSNLDNIDDYRFLDSSLESENENAHEIDVKTENYESCLSTSIHENYIQNCSENSNHLHSQEENPEAENNDNSEASDTESVTEPTLAADNEIEEFISDCLTVDTQMDLELENIEDSSLNSNTTIANALINESSVVFNEDFKSDITIEEQPNNNQALKNNYLLEEESNDNQALSNSNCNELSNYCENSTISCLQSEKEVITENSQIDVLDSENNSLENEAKIQIILTTCEDNEIDENSQNTKVNETINNNALESEESASIKKNKIEGSSV